ncbi:MAG: hypothetical protein K2K46_11760, partial [Lachnospiraceae bacterium]|nr:hypothetical protein [Lachnospiraceae bacterium]
MQFFILLSKSHSIMHQMLHNHYERWLESYAADKGRKAPKYHKHHSPNSYRGRGYRSLTAKLPV